MIIQPLSAYRFRIRSCATGVAQNVEDVEFNFHTKRITVKVRATVKGDDFRGAVWFANSKIFKIDAMSANDEILFSIAPMGLETEDHNLALSYANAKYAIHTFKFSYSDLDIQTPISEDSDDKPVSQDPAFPDVATAMAQLTDDKTGLDDGNELRQDAGC